MTLINRVDERPPSVCWGGHPRQRSEVNTGVTVKSYHVSDVKMQQIPTLPGLGSYSQILVHVDDDGDSSVLNDPPLEL